MFNDFNEFVPPQILDQNRAWISFISGKYVWK